MNLLQPQDRRSAEPGDARSAVEARAALERAGVGQALVDVVVHRMHELALPSGAVVADLGCGTGHALAAVCRGRDVAGVGIDLSAAAATHAARHWPGPTWVVANADRRLPLLDRSVNVVVSLHARRNPREVARVLEPDGMLVIAVPAPDDLVELRALVQGTGVTRDRVPALVAVHQPHFELAGQLRVTDSRRLDREALRALLGATYRGARAAEAGRVAALTDLEVTLASDLCLFAPLQ